MKSNKYKIPNNNEWKKRFFVPTIQWVYFARNNPNKALLVSNISGKFELHSKDFKTNSLNQVTKRPNGTIFGSISPDGKYIYFVNDKRGNEHGHFTRVPLAGGKSVDITPKLPPYLSYSVQSDNLGKFIVFSASIGKENRVYLATFNEKGQPKKTYQIWKSLSSIKGPIISPDGNYACISIQSPATNKSEIIIIDNLSRKSISRMRINGAFSPLSFSKKSNKMILGVNNKQGFNRPALVDLDSKKIEEISHKKLLGEVFILTWSDNEENLLICDVNEAQHNLFIYNLIKKTAKRVGPSNGSFDLSFGSAAFLPDKSILVKWQAFGVPSQIIKLASPFFKKIKIVYSPTSISEPKRILKKIWFKSSDSAKIQMWIAKPDSSKRKLPFIIDIHGGPDGIISDEFMTEAHVWLDRGFGYCAINYRGSIGFGKKFEEKIYGNPGHWEVEDIVAARRWLIENGLADSKKIIMYGWSWGGYITLLTLGKYPDLWLGGIAGTPIADFILQYEDEPAFLQSLDRLYFGGTPDEVPQRYIRSSPVTYVKKFKDPALIIHGENDVRCPPRQINSFVGKMKKYGKLITVHKFSSGHAGEFSDTKIRLENISIALKFATNLINKNSPGENLGEKRRRAR